MLEWKGSHLGVTVSPDGQFLVTSMQEPMLHGWRIVDRKDMRMSGYGARVSSLDWTRRRQMARHVGLDPAHLVAVPSQGRARWARRHVMLAPMEAQVEVVACHPTQDVVAVGYADGLVLLVRIEDGAEILAKKPGDAPVTALAWSADGELAGLRHRNGEAGLVDLR